MLTTRRNTTSLGLTALLLTLLLFSFSRNRRSWRDIPQVVGLGDVFPEPKSTNTMEPSQSKPTGSRKLGGWDPKAPFVPGIPKLAGSNYSRSLVMARLREDNVSWVTEELSDWDGALYVADDPSAPLHPPKNKGHEVMIYLTYIVENYDTLSDVTAFIHSHRWSWHNNDLLDNDAADMLRRLSSERVTREGYMNLRCHWMPGCPDWMHPGVTTEDINKQEETALALCWSELFPSDPVPQVLAQPCCAQFAVSRQRIQSIPKPRYVFFRDWLLRTELDDYISGRVWEYLWQYIFSGESTFCPVQNVCYCDGYGICFGGEQEFDKWFEIRYNKRELQFQLAEWNEKARAIENARNAGQLDEAAQLEVPEVGKDSTLKAQIDSLQQELDRLLAEARRRGDDPRARAYEAGRAWKAGDGF